eukprot:4428401-Alexandrium_andersonii.AAC.1
MSLLKHRPQAACAASRRGWPRRLPRRWQWHRSIGRSVVGCAGVAPGAASPAALPRHRLRRLLPHQAHRRQQRQLCAGA